MGAEHSKHEAEPVAVVGMACRFPGAEDLTSYWRLLSDGRDAVTEVPQSRWHADDYYSADLNHAGKMATRWGGFISNVAGFDASLFGINNLEASRIDPQQRLLLETVWSALEDANQPPLGLKGTRSGVYIGISSSDYSLLQFRDPTFIDAYAGTGNSHCIAANRISFCLDLRGPSFSVDTACSSSLVALHLAVRALRSGEIDSALVGGVNLLLRPELTIAFSKAGMMSPDGRCRAFSDAANGYVRGEGCGVVFLKRLRDCGEQRIWATVRGTAVNQDGRSNGITAPNGPAQEAVIRAALQDAALDAGQIGYIEAHGTGTPLGDPIEYHALQRVFGARRREHPCLVGSVKTNFGHLEAAAGVAGLIKAALAMHHGVVPGHLYCEKLNPQIVAMDGVLEIARGPRPWPALGAQRIAGVSSFGFGGTNAHAILQGPVSEPAHGTAGAWTAPVTEELLCVSANTLPALRDLVAGHVRLLQEQPQMNLAALSKTAMTGRSHLKYRLAVIAAQPANLLRELQAATPEHAAADKFPAVRSKPAMGVVGLCAGQGAQYPAMGRELYERSSIVRAELERCDRILRTLLGFSVLDELLHAADGERIKQTIYAQPALFIVEYAIAQVWLRTGLRFSCLLGHSLGEYVAATLAGMMTLEGALTLVAQRARLMQSVGGEQRMQVVFAAREQVQELLLPWRERYDVAAVNAPANTVIAADAATMQEMCAELTRAAVRQQPLQVSHAFHSRLFDPILDEFESIAATVRYAAPTIPVLSNLTGQLHDMRRAVDARYWRNHLRQTVLFDSCLSTLAARRPKRLLELGPASGLTALAQVALGEGVRSSAGLRRGAEWRSVLEAVREFYLEGCELDYGPFWQAVPSAQFKLPPYPFERRNFWFVAPDGAVEAPRKDESAATALVEKEATMVTVPLETQPQSESGAQVLSKLVSVLAEVLEMPESEVDVEAPLSELGADSLVLLRTQHKIESHYQLAIPLSRLVSEYSTLNALSNYIASVRPQVPASEPAVPTAVAIPDRAPAAGTSVPHSLDAAAGSHAAMLARIVEQQLSLLGRQLELLGAPVPSTAQSTAPQIATQPAPRANPLHAVPATVLQSPVQAAAPAAALAPAKSEDNTVKRFNRFSALAGAAPEAISRNKHDYLESLTRTHTAKTAASKQFAAAHRPVLADNRASAGFRLSTKELVYPIVGTRAQGARLWDADGNEYLDFTMGFGVNLFGHAPAFVAQALKQQIEQGMPLGPQAADAGMAAQLLCQLTGHERALFCNTGSEATMTAVRLARAVTGRPKVVIFSGAYHGTFDGFLAQSIDGTTVPFAAGTPPSMLADTVVLEYASEAALQFIEAHAASLAAVLVEPVQARQPQLQPREFLQRLRSLTQRHDIAFIFDEMIWGFRLAPGGAQEYFGIQADLATYGKILGGGMPIGAIAGSRRYLDAIDGGQWRYGDDSFPSVDTIFFAGTFSKNPMSMTASRVVLEHLQAAGPALQRELNERTEWLARELNAQFTKGRYPIAINHCGSLFRFSFKQNLDLLFYRLLDRGIYIWEGRNCFLSTAHSDADVQQLVSTVRETVAELAQHEWITGLKAVPADGTRPLSKPQRRFARLAAEGRMGSLAGNLRVAIRLRGELQIEHLHQAVECLVRRHEMLRARVDIAAGTQQIQDGAPICFAHVSAPEELPAAEVLEQWLCDHAESPIFEERSSALFNIELLQLAPDDQVFMMSCHHLICDGISLGILLQELADTYSALVRGTEPKLAAAGSYLKALEEAERVETAATITRYWSKKGAGAAFRATPPFPRRQQGGYAASQHSRDLSELIGAVSSSATDYGVTPYIVLLAAFTQALAEWSDSRRVVVGVPFAGKVRRKSGEPIVGDCTTMLPVCVNVAAGQGAQDLLAQVRTELIGAAQHEIDYVSLEKLLWETPAGEDVAEISAVFNLDLYHKRPSFADLEDEILQVPAGASEFALMVDVQIIGTDAQVLFTYAANAISAERVATLAQRYLEVLSDYAMDESRLVQAAG